jgi:energy-coupling factor transport system permease protein
MKDITIGQYYPVDSVVHRLDPRVKLFGTLVFIISLFITKHYFVYGVITVCLIAALKLSKVPIRLLLKGIRGILFLLLFSVVFNLFFIQGKTLVHFWFITITVEGLKKAIFLGIRLIYLVIGTSLMTLTTAPTDLADGLEKAFRPLNKLHVPVHDITMMMSIALRFIPILMEETDKIKKAQMARGADFESGGLIKRVKSMIPLFIPLFVSAIRRALDLANAMEARCYQGGEGRTKLHPLKYVRRDAVTYGVYVLYLVVVIGVNHLLVAYDVFPFFSI